MLLPAGLSNQVREYLQVHEELLGLNSLGGILLHCQLPHFFEEDLLRIVSLHIITDLLDFGALAALENQFLLKLFHLSLHLAQLRFH